MGSRGISILPHHTFFVFPPSFFRNLGLVFMPVYTPLFPSPPFALATVAMEVRTGLQAPPRLFSRTCSLRLLNFTTCRAEQRRGRERKGEQAKLKTRKGKIARSPQARYSPQLHSFVLHFSKHIDMANSQALFMGVPLKFVSLFTLTVQASYSSVTSRDELTCLPSYRTAP